MPKITSYPNGSSLTALDRFVIARSGKNYSLLGSQISAGGTLFANAVFYVRSDGNDGNSGLGNTAALAWRTRQYGVDRILKMDLNGYSVVLVCGSETVTTTVTISGRPKGQKLPSDFQIWGDLVSPSNCKSTVAGGDCFYVTNGAMVTIRGFQMSTTGSGNCLNVDTLSYLVHGTNIFGACAGMHVQGGTNAVIYEAYDYSISGGAVAHWHLGSPSYLFTNPITVTLSGTPAFSAYFAGLAESHMNAAYVTFAGTGATGKRFVVHKDASLDVGASGTLTTLPGNAAGTRDNGGEYIYGTSINAAYQDGAALSQGAGGIAPSAGAITTATGTCRYCYNEYDNKVHAIWTLTITDKGTGSGNLQITVLPLVPTGNAIIRGINATYGKTITGYLSGTTFYMFYSDGTYPIQNSGDLIILDATYERA